MKEMLIILVSAILVDNFVLSKFMGICPFLGVSKKIDSAIGMSVAVTFVMCMATAITWPIYTFFLAPYGLDYLTTVAFILIIALFVQLIEILLKKFMPPLHKALGVYLPFYLSATAAIGGAIRFLADKLAPSFEKDGKGTIIASGLLGGESIVGVIIAMYCAYQIIKY